MALTSVWTVVRWFRKTTSESRNETPYIDPDHLPLVAVSFIGLTVMVVLVSFVGTYISIALFLGFYMRVIRKHSWGLTTATVIGMVLMVYFLFEWQLSIYLPKGLPVFVDGFLWIDNFRWTYLM